MPTKTSVVPPEVFQIKVTLLGTMPPIWRRLLVPSDLTLAHLHDVLRSAMGWQDCHMHEFSAGHRLMEMPPVENERAVCLSSVLVGSAPRPPTRMTWATVGSMASCWRSVC